DHREELLRLGHERSVALGGRYDRLDAISHQLKKHPLAPHGNHVVGKFDQNVGSPPKGWSGSVATYLPHNFVVHSQLAAESHQRPSTKLLVHLIHPALEKVQLVSRMNTVERMRSCDHARNAVLGRRPAHLDRFVQGRRTIIDSPEYVAVNVCHHDSIFKT